MPLRAPLLVLAQLATLLAPLHAAGQTAVEIPAGRAPFIDGILAAGEWDDAARVDVEVEPGWTVSARHKHDGAYLYFAFDGLVRGARERYPEVLLDLGGSPGAQWGEHSHWFHASYRDCDAVGRRDAYDSCAPQRPGWAANNFPLAAGAVEMRIAFGRVHLVTGRARPIRLALLLTDTRGADSLWPRGAAAESPSTWAVAVAPDRWGVPVARPGIPSGRVDTLRIASGRLGTAVSVPVYLPPGYDPDRSYPTVYALSEPVYFRHPGVTLPLLVDSALAAGVPAGLVVGVPGSDEADAHHPDTATGERWRGFILEEVIPAVESRYAARRDRGGRHLLGFSSGANVAVDLAARHPDAFGCAAAQSPGWMDATPSRRALGRIFLSESLRTVRSLRRESPPAFWLVWGDGDTEWESRSREHGILVMRALRERGARVVRAPDLAGEHGLHQINRSLGSALAFLLGEDCSGETSRVALP